VKEKMLFLGVFGKRVPKNTKGGVL